MAARPSKVWQAPPGWPQPPDGWSPWWGWRPPPQWPPAPPGWPWWRRTRAGRVRLIAAGAAGGLLVLVAGWFAVATGGGHITSTVEYRSGSGCVVSGGPHWLFGVMLGAGAVAVLYGFVWGFLLAMQGRAAASAQARTGWARWLPALVVAFNLASVLVLSASQPGGVARGLLLLGGMLAVALPGLATLMVVSRRATVTGTFPRARAAPLGMFWVSVVVSVLALGVSVGALVEQIARGHSC